MVLSESEVKWEQVKKHFLQINEVKKQGESLKIRQKMFAMLGKGKFTLKMPKDRVTQLLESGIGEPYDPGNGKIMKEWVIIPIVSTDKWIEYAEEARIFALSLAK